MDPSPDKVPVRETPSRAGPKDVSTFLKRTAAQEGATISRLSREDLEDRYLRIYEDHLVLKRHAHKQEDRMKRMATKLTRIVNDKKKGVQGDVSLTGPAPARDPESEERIAELEEEVRELRKQVTQLQEKNTILKQQAAVLAKRGSSTGIYDAVSARIDTGVQPKQSISSLSNVPPHLRAGMRAAGSPSPVSRSASAASNVAAAELTKQLADAREENKKLEEIVKAQQDRAENLEQRLLQLEADKEAEISKLRATAISSQRDAVKENVEMIRLQKDLKGKSAELNLARTRYSALEELVERQKASHEHLLIEMEELGAQLAEERGKNLALSEQIRAEKREENAVEDLNLQVGRLSQENSLLREANQKITASAFELENDRKHRQQMEDLKVQVLQLEATLKAELSDKASVLDRLNAERDQVEAAEKENRELRKNFYAMKGEFEEMQSKVAFLTQRAPSFDLTEIGEALELLRRRKAEKRGADAVPEGLEFLKKIEKEKTDSLEKKLAETEIQLVESVQELEKTRNLLIIQHKINKDYQKELELSQKRLDSANLDFDARAAEYARLLDVRAARIEKLEAKLKDIAYGTQRRSIPLPTTTTTETAEDDFAVDLLRGRNVFVIHVLKTTLTQTAMEHLAEPNPAVFCSWEFFEHPIQTTGVLAGPESVFDYHSRYVVTVDDFFLHFLQREATLFEIHQAFGADYRTIAATRVSFADVLACDGRFHAASRLVGVDHFAGVDMGVLEFSVRLSTPMPQALRLYNERAKALNFLQSPSSHPLSDAVRDVNRLVIRLVSASDVGVSRYDPPSIYAIYRFHDRPHHDTRVHERTRDVRFDDVQNYAVKMDTDLDAYLKRDGLKISLFDDASESDLDSFLGACQIPLLPLAHGNEIKGVFELFLLDGVTVGGVVRVEMAFEFPYRSTTGAEVTFNPTPVYLPGERAGEEVSPNPPLETPIPKPRAIGGESRAPPLVPRSVLSEIETVEDARTTSTPSAPPRTSVVVSSEKRDVTSSESDGDKKEATRWAEEDSSIRKASTTEAAAPQSVTPPPDAAAPQPATPAPQKVVVRLASDKLNRLKAVQAEMTRLKDLGPAATNEDTTRLLSLNEEQKQIISAGSSPSEAAAAAQPPAPSKPDTPSGKQTVRLSRQNQQRLKEIQEEMLSIISKGGGSSGENRKRLEVLNLEQNKIIEEGKKAKTSGSKIPEPTAATKPPTPASRSSLKQTTPAAVAGHKQEKSETIEPTYASRKPPLGDDDDDEDSLDEALAARAKPSVSYAPPEPSTPADSDSDGVVVSRSTLRSSMRRSSSEGNNVCVTVSSLSFDPASSVLRRDGVKRVFVEYKFLDFPPEDLETPFSLPLSTKTGSMNFNFRKSFPVDAAANYRRRQLLAAMIDETGGVAASSLSEIPFTIVSEPNDSDGEETGDAAGECEDLGVAVVDLKEILKKKKDFVEEDVPVFESRESRVVVGHLKLSVECLPTLLKVKEEMDAAASLRDGDTLASDRDPAASGAAKILVQ